MSQQKNFWLALAACILLGAGTAAAGIYWLPDYLKDNVDSNHRTDTDKGGGDNVGGTCEQTYGQLSSCPSPKVIDKEYNYGKIMCYSCKCPSSYQITSCSSGWHVAGVPCKEGTTTYYTGCEADACPGGFTAGLTCGAGYTREVNGKSGSLDCVRCNIKPCTSGYTAGVANCNSKTYPAGWTYASSGYSGDSICGKCTEKTCTSGFEKGLNNCSGKAHAEGWTYSSSGYAGDSVCGKCTAKTCASGYQAGVSKCSSTDSWTYSSSGYAGDSVCGLCTAKSCADTFIAGLENCSNKAHPSGWSYVKSHNSGNTVCGKCDVKACTSGSTSCASGLIPSANNYFSGDQQCYACQTCEEIGKKTCNGGCIATSECCGGCGSGEVCKNGTCVVQTCESILTDRGYGLNTNLPNKTNVIMNDMTFSRMEGTTYIGIDNFTSISQCRGKSRPKLTFNKVGNLDNASFTNLNLYIKASDTGNIEVRNTLTLKNTDADVTPTTINIPSGAGISMTDSKIVKNGSAANTLNDRGYIYFYGTSEVGNVNVYDSGRAAFYKNGKVNSITTNSSSSSISVSSGAKLESTGAITITSGSLTTSGTSKSNSNISGKTLSVTGTLKAPYTNIKLTDNFIVNKNGSFSANNASVTAAYGKLYNGASISIANAVDMTFKKKFSCAVSTITLGTCDSLSPENNNDHGIFAYEFELGQVDGTDKTSNTRINLCGGSKMSFVTDTNTLANCRLNQYNKASICLEYYAWFQCSGNVSPNNMMNRAFIEGQTDFSWSNCRKKFKERKDKCK